MGPLTSRTLRVVVADESELAREAVAYLLTSISNVELVARCDDVESLTAAVASERPDIVVIDVGLSRSVGGDGVAVADRLLDDFSTLGVLELGHAAELPAVRQDAGRPAYVRKGQLLDSDHLAAALNDATR